MKREHELLTYLNGEVIPHSQAVTALKEQSIRSSSGFYDSERTFGGRIFKLRQHLERLYNGLDFANVDPGMDIDRMEAITHDVLKANRPVIDPADEFLVTQVVSLSAQATEAGSRPNVVVFCQRLDFSAFAMGYVTGVRLATPATYPILEQRPAGAGKGDSHRVITLMTSREGSITECTGANFMFVRDSRIKLPDRHSVLPGVSMQTVLELAESLGIAVDEDEYAISDVYEADEAFVSSTRYCMLPASTVNGYSLARELPGPVTRRLTDSWRRLFGLDHVRS